MSDQQQAAEHAANGGGEVHRDSAEVVEAKAQHRQAMAVIENEDRRALADMYRSLPIPLRVMFDPMMNERVQLAAQMMSKAAGFTPRHLIGQTEACFVVVTKALTWRLDPQAVAASTYQTPDGKIGYEGKLIQAIIEGSGKLSRPIGQGEYFGDWSKVEGRFKIEKRRSQSGKEYDAPVPQWEYYGADEEGLGVRYQIHLNGQDAPMTFEFKLRSAFPRNATTWPTRPQQQLHYAAMRALGNVVCPSLLMGVPFEGDMAADQPPMRDITPKAPPPVDLAAEGIKGGGETATTGRTFDQERETGEKSNTTMRASGPDGGGVADNGGGMAKGDTQPANGNTQEGDTVDPETGEVTEAKPKRQRRSYREITDDVIAMLADAESPDEVDAIVDDQVTGGVRSNTELMGEINKAAQEAHQRFAEQNQERAPAPAAEAQDQQDDGEFDLGGAFGRSA